MKSVYHRDMVAHIIGLQSVNRSLKSELESTKTELAGLRESLEALCGIVEKQAKDEGLWFISRTCPESYLQQELRKLHAAIEEIEV